MDANIQFTGPTQQTLQRLGQAPQGLRTVLLRTMDEQNQITVGHIQRVYLSFPRDAIGPVIGLRVRTNRLRGSLWAAKARATGGQLISSIGTNVNYAGVHEYGFNGPIQVRAFTRRDNRRSIYRVHVRTRAAVFERREPWDTRKAKRIAPAVKIFEMQTGRIVNATGTSGKLIAQGVVRVKAHTRHAHYAERAPIRRGIADRVPAYNVAIEGAAVAFLAGGAR